MQCVLVNPPRLRDGIRLVATKLAISCAGLFVVSTLVKWGARSILTDSVQITEELVTNAVKATGVMEERVNWNELTRIEHITVRLLGFDTTVRIEVWDSTPNLSRTQDEYSHIRRGSYPTPKGKVVWAELPLRRYRPLHHPSSLLRTLTLSAVCGRGWRVFDARYPHVVFLDGRALPGHRDQHAQRGGGVVGHVAVEVGQPGGVGQAAADEQEVSGAGGGDPDPGVVTFALGAWSARGDLRSR